MNRVLCLFGLVDYLFLCKCDSDSLQCILIFMRMCVRDVLVLRVGLLRPAGAALLPSALLCSALVSGFLIFHGFCAAL